MDKVFVDTSAWLALLDEDEPRQRAIEAWFRAGGVRYITSSDVFDEAVTFANARWGHRIASLIGKTIRDNPEVHFVHVEPEFQAEAWSLFQARPDKGYSLTDCTSFVIMRRMDVRDAATLDEDFAQEGFRVVP